MKKIILLLFILVSGTFIYLKLQVLGDEHSNFNQTTRYKLGQYAWLRSALGLHNDGDARGWYLSGQGPIVIEVVRATGTVLDDKAIAKFQSLVERYTGRSTVLFNEELISSDKLSENDLATVVSQHRHHEVSGDANLFIIYANDFERKGGEVGRTFQEYGIVLSDTRLREVTTGYPQSLDEYVESTLLHEFGHQIGLDHDLGDNCIMNEKVESPTSSGLFSDHFTQTDFCKAEAEQILKIKTSFQ